MLRTKAGRVEPFDPPPTVRHLAVRGLEFLRAQAPRTQFCESAEILFEKGQMGASGALEGLANILESWADHVDEGFATSLPFEVRSRQEAATDLMEQVRQLLDDSKVHVAAPVVLAGAALEEFLRGMVSGTPSAVVKGKPGLQAYAEALKTAGVLNANDVKDVISIAALRNDAAHGDFANLSRQRAELMAQQVNLFVSQHLTSSSP